MKRLLLTGQLTLLLQLFLATVALAVTNTGVIVGGDCVRGNRVKKTIERKLGEFTILETSGAFTVFIKSGAMKQQVKITGDANILPLITTSLQGNKLVVSTERSICTELGITLEISMSSLEALVSNGSDTIKAQGIDAHQFVLDMGGSGDVELSGQSLTLNANISGAGDLNAKNLKSKECALNISGSGTANVYASEKLKVEILGAADVNYFGHPKQVEKQILGAGDINAMD